MEGNHLCNFETGHHREHSCEVDIIIPVVQEEISFKEKVCARGTTTDDDGQRPITIAHFEPSAQVS